MKLLMMLGLLLLGGRLLAQTNVELLDQLVTESQSEHDRQATARTNQATVTANESVNKTQMTTLKTTYRDIQSRFHTLGLVIDAGAIGLEAAPLSSDILAKNEQIISLCRQHPLLIPLAAESEAELAGQASLLISYSFGLILSIGDVNQMKASDRKLLFGYVVSELRRIDGASRGLLNTMLNYCSSLDLKSLNPFAGFINQDKRMVDDIVSKKKQLQ